MYRQKSIKGGRIPTGSSLMKSIRSAVESDSRRFNVSRSFVVATVLAHHYRIREQEDFKTISRASRKNKKGS